MIDRWIYEEKLLFNGTTYSWTPKALQDLDVTESVGELSALEKLKTTHINTAPNRDLSIPPTWLADFISKFSAKNLGVSGKTTDKSSVVKRLIKFLSEYDYTLVWLLYLQESRRSRSKRFS